MTNGNLCALVRTRKMKLLSLIISSSKTAMKRKYLGLPLITITLKFTLKFHDKIHDENSR